MSNLFTTLKEKVSGNQLRIVFPEGMDERILEAAGRLAAEKTIIPILVGNIDEKYTSLNVWVELLKFGCVSAKIEKIENILENGEIVLNLPLGICIINRVSESSRIDHIHFGKIRDILSNAEFIILNDDLLEIGDLGFENHKNLKRI